MRSAGAGRDRHRSSAATGRWIGTAAGIASSAPTTCSSHGRAEHRCATARGGRPGSVRAGRDRRVHHARRSSASEALIRARRLACSRSTSAPTGCASSTRALAEPGFTEVDRGGAPVVERYATMTEYEEGWPYPVAFPPQHPTTTLSIVIAGQRRAPAPRRRNREVPARDVLLQRRRGGSAARRAARAGALAARRPTYDLKP